MKKLSTIIKTIDVLVFLVGSLWSYLLIGGYYYLGEKEIHLIPEGYTGIVRIFFDQPNGKEEKYEGGYRVYEIDSNGMLVTRFKLNSGIFNHSNRLFFYHNSGHRTKIPEIPSNKNEINRSKVMFLGGGVGTKGFIECHIKNIKHILEYGIDSLNSKMDYTILNFKCSDLPQNITDNADD